MSGDPPINSTVLIAPHHGANNASSNCFINAVDPEWVIFSSGHDHRHPRTAVAERYLNHGIDITQIFRTDFGDNEGGTEWPHASTNFPDTRGDDDIEIIITNDGEITVKYD